MFKEIITFGPSFFAASLIVLVTLFVHRLKFLHNSHGTWLDIFAGVSLGYIFIDILPHLASYQIKLSEAIGREFIGFIQHHAYLIAMVGFLSYMAIVLAEESLRSGIEAKESKLNPYLHMAVGVSAISISSYIFLIGYMLSEQATHRPTKSFVFGLVMTAHIIGLDHFYRDRFPQLYDNKIRYVFSFAVYIGWIIGFLTEIPDYIFTLMLTFLAGGLMIVTTMFELPRVKSWRNYAGFCIGAIVFCVLILISESIDR